MLKCLKNHKKPKTKKGGFSLLFQYKRKKKKKRIYLIEWGKWSLFGFWYLKFHLRYFLPFRAVWDYKRLATVRSGIDMAKQWGVLQTHLNASAVALQNLKRQGYETYNPRYNERVVARGRFVTWRRSQLFKDYMFVKIESRWRSLMSTRGVKRLILWHENQPALINNNIIQELRDREDPETGLIEVTPHNSFLPGQSVQFKDGLFAWQYATYDDQSNEDRVFVLLSLLGSLKRIQVNKRDLIAA